MISHEPSTFVTRPFFEATKNTPFTTILSAWEAFKTGMRAVAPDQRGEEISLYYITLELFDDVFSFGFFYHLAFDESRVQIDEDHQLSFEFVLRSEQRPQNLENQYHEFDDHLESSLLNVESLEVFKAVCGQRAIIEISEGEP